MSEYQTFEADLREMLDRGQVAAVVGSGVSTATTRRAPSWRTLIQSGVERCRSIGASHEWCQTVLSQLQLESEPDMLLSAAELVHHKLGQNGGGELAR
jgi:hypothetical protein